MRSSPFKSLTQAFYGQITAISSNKKMHFNKILTQAKEAQLLHVSKAPVQKNVLHAIPCTGYFDTRLPSVQVA